MRQFFILCTTHPFYIFIACLIFVASAIFALRYYMRFKGNRMPRSIIRCPDCGGECYYVTNYYAGIIIHCPDCGVKWHYVANCYTKMPPKRKGLSPLALEEIYHAGWAIIIHNAKQKLTKTELVNLRRLQFALEPIQTQVRIRNPYDAILTETEVVKSEDRQPRPTTSKTEAANVRLLVAKIESLIQTLQQLRFTLKPIRAKRDMASWLRDIVDWSHCMYLVRLWFADRAAVVIDHSPKEAKRRAQLYEPNGGWEHASVEIITRIPFAHTPRVLSLERLGRQ